MIGDYDTDREWADKFLAKQMAILQPIVQTYFPRQLKIADRYRDMHHAADLVILRDTGNELPDIGLRVRRPKYAGIYGLCEFTLRSFRRNSVPTELRKITSGRGQWFSYFHSDDNGNLPHWMVVDLEGVRLNIDQNPGRPQMNKDLTTGFHIFDVRRFPVGILLAASDGVLTALPFMYQTAIRRRQSLQWEPYKGLAREKIMAAVRELERLKRAIADAAQTEASRLAIEYQIAEGHLARLVERFGPNGYGVEGGDDA